MKELFKEPTVQIVDLRGVDIMTTSGDPCDNDTEIGGNCQIGG